MANETLIDSGPLVALFDKDDQYHTEALEFIKKFSGRLLSTLAVLTEVCYLLDFSIEAQVEFLTWVRNGAVQLVDINQSDLVKIIESTEKYSDLPMDFADSTLVAIGDRLNISKIATIDSDFYIYRFQQKGPFTNIFLRNE